MKKYIVLGALLLMIPYDSYLSASSRRASIGSMDFSEINGSNSESRRHSVLNIPTMNSVSLNSFPHPRRRISHFDNSRRNSTNPLNIPTVNSIYDDMDSSLVVSEVISDSDVSRRNLHLESVFYPDEQNAVCYDQNYNMPGHKLARCHNVAGVLTPPAEKEPPIITAHEAVLVPILNEAVIVRTLLIPQMLRDDLNSLNNASGMATGDSTNIYNLSIKTFALEAKQKGEYDVYGKGVVIRGGISSSAEDFLLGIHYGVTQLVAKNTYTNVGILAHTISPYVINTGFKVSHSLSVAYSMISFKGDLKDNKGANALVAGNLFKEIDLSNKFKLTPKVGLTYNYLSIASSTNRSKQDIQELFFNSGVALNKEIVLSKKTVITPEITYNFGKEVWQRSKKDKAFLIKKQPNDELHRIGLQVWLNRNTSDWLLSYNYSYSTRYRDQALSLSYKINF